MKQKPRTLVARLIPELLAQDTQSRGGLGTVGDVLQELALHTAHHLRELAKAQ
ncbi:hypothetical protein [Tengunoibacter tsumagoiensis]|uniref:Uncharacterized protein n=1 Tax=Tengunoibacter tsumagoiensis TaxID=2014871 RepID=A0A401ZYN0_9CHLR|nr:hypothetical protein [Tengunoibacter tsumagoiensis]GCE11951.1 hypothetical protein KTT_18100 [Tengunoibacter tsumagoiensis]